MQGYLENQGSMDLRQVAHTLLYGRETMEYRSAFVALDKQDLQHQMGDWLANIEQASAQDNSEKAQASLYGHVIGTVYDRTDFALPDDGKELARQLLDIAKAWEQGEAFNWHNYVPETAYKMLALPTYPFDTRRCWVEHSDNNAYQDSQFFKIETTFEEANGIISETIGEYIHSTIAAFFGLKTGELSVKEPLSRYQLLAAFLPRLAFHLQERLAQDIDIDAIMTCRTVDEIVDVVSGGNYDSPVDLNIQTQKSQPKESENSNSNNSQSDQQNVGKNNNQRARRNNNRNNKGNNSRTNARSGTNGQARGRRKTTPAGSK